MWNVVKFAMQFLGEEYKAPEAGVEGVLAGRKHRLEDEWILSLLEESVEKANEGFDELQLGKVFFFLFSFFFFLLTPSPPFRPPPLSNLSSLILSVMSTSSP